MINIIIYLRSDIYDGVFGGGEINGGDKYGGFTEKPPHYPCHIFTGPNIIFAISTFYYF